MARRLKERDGPANYRDEPTTTTAGDAETSAGHRVRPLRTLLCVFRIHNGAKPALADVSSRPNHRRRRHATATTTMTQGRDGDKMLTTQTRHVHIRVVTLLIHISARMVASGFDRFNDSRRSIFMLGILAYMRGRALTAENTEQPLHWSCTHARSHVRGDMVCARIRHVSV